jgi:hypothetical protein
MKFIFENWRKHLNENKLLLYHHTSPENANVIKTTGDWQSKIRTSQGTEIYFSNSPEGQAGGYGKAVVEIEIPEEFTHLDDEFPDGERHYWVDAADLRYHAKIKN